LVLESCHIPSPTNTLVLIRCVTSTEYKQFDSSKGINGNPVLVSAVGGTGPITILNTSQDFNSLSIPSNFLQKQFLDFELECPMSNTTLSLMAFTSGFYLALKIIDVDPELTEDRPQLDMANYNSGKVPLRIYS